MKANEPMSDDMLTDDEREIITEEYIRSVKRELAEALAEVDRLRAREQALAAENAVMRPMVDAVAEAEAEPMQLYASEGDAVYVAELAASEGWEETTITIHVPRDTYERARAFVAAHPTAAGEAESEGE